MLAFVRNRAIAIDRGRYFLCYHYRKTAIAITSDQAIDISAIKILVLDRTVFCILIQIFVLAGKADRIERLLSTNYRRVIAIAMVVEPDRGQPFATGEEEAVAGRGKTGVALVERQGVRHSSGGVAVALGYGAVIVNQGYRAAKTIDQRIGSRES